jgi:hypothetical protein
MKKLSGRLERSLRLAFPNLYYNLVQRPRLFFQFRDEKRLIAGRLQPHSPQTSIIFFTTQKCASRFVGSMLEQLAAGSSLLYADYDALVATTRPPAQQDPFKGATAAFYPNGVLFGPIGSYRPIPNLEQFKVLLQLRDPRDVLTSLYYSTAYSHAVISPKLIRRRKEAQTMDVDTYVLASIEEYVSIYTAYCEKLLPMKNVLFVRYEDMVTDFPRWLAAVSAHLGLDSNPTLLRQIEKEADFSVGSEDKFSHRRQVTPGDHKRKLRPETIQAVTQAFAPALKTLGYSQ